MARGDQVADSRHALQPEPRSPASSSSGSLVVPALANRAWRANRTGGRPRPCHGACWVPSASVRVAFRVVGSSQPSFVAFARARRARACGTSLPFMAVHSDSPGCVTEIIATVRYVQSAG